jgi:hypothetical protein
MYLAVHDFGVRWPQAATGRRNAAGRGFGRLRPVFLCLGRGHGKDGTVVVVTAAAGCGPCDPEFRVLDSVCHV